MKKFIILIFYFAALSAVGQTKSIDSLKSVLNLADGDGKIKPLIDLCWEYRFINADSARNYGLRALDLSRKAKLQDFEVEALHNIGITLEAQGNYKDALTYELEALDLRKKIGDDAKTANTLNTLGIIHDEQGDYQKALEYYFEARKIYERLDNDSKIAMVLVNIGIVLRAQKEAQKALAYYYQAMSIYKKLDNHFALAACHANLGSVYLNIPNYDSSLHYSLLASHEFEKQNNQQFLPSTLFNIGIAYDSLGKYKSAQEYLSKARILYEKYDNKRELSSVLIQLADIYLKTNQLPLAELSTRKAILIADQIGALEQQMHGHQRLAEIQAKSKNFSAAYDEQRLYSKIKDSLFQTEKSNQMAELQTKYETEKKEKELDIQKLVISEQNLTLERKQTYIIGLISLLTLLTIVVILWRSRLKLKQQQRIEQQQRAHQEELTTSVIELQERERSRFAQDLHDGFGQMITALKFQFQNTSSQTKDSSQLISQMHDEIRNVSFALSPQVLVRDGLIQALKELSERLNKSGKVSLTVQSTGLENRLNANTEITIYRICQEWINNVLKYSGAKTIILQLVSHPQELLLTIEDDGEGFDASILETGKGNGWRNIQSRALVLKGEVEIDTQSGRKGSTFILTIPNLKSTKAE